MGLGRAGAKGWTYNFKLAHLRGQRPSKNVVNIEYAKDWKAKTKEVKQFVKQ